MIWYVEIALFAFALPLLARSYQERIPFRASHQALALSLVWLGIQLSAPARPSNNAVLLAWLFIYAFGTLVLLYGRLEEAETLDRERKKKREKEEGGG